MRAAINAHIEFGSDGFPFKDTGSLVNIVVSAARATGYDRLIHSYLAARGDLIGQSEFIVLEKLAPLEFAFVQYFVGVGEELAQSIYVARMEGKRYHRLHFRKVYLDEPVVICAFVGLEFLIVGSSAARGKIFFHFFVGSPHARKTGGFRGHDVYAVTEFYRKILNPLAHEFEHFVLYEAFGEYRSDKAKRHVLRTYALTGRAFEVHGDHVGICHVVSFADDLLDEFGTALAHRHGAERAVTCMRVGA